MGKVLLGEHRGCVGDIPRRLRVVSRLQGWTLPMNILAWLIAGLVAAFAIISSILEWMGNNGINPFN